MFPITTCIPISMMLICLSISLLRLSRRNNNNETEENEGSNEMESNESTVIDYSAIQDGDSNLKNFGILILILLVIGLIVGGGYVYFNWDHIKNKAENSFVEKQMKVERDIDVTEMVDTVKVELIEPDDTTKYIPVMLNDAVRIEVYYDIYTNDPITKQNDFDIKYAISKYLAYIQCGELLINRGFHTDELSKIIRDILGSDNLKAMQWNFVFPDYIMELRERYIKAKQDVEQAKLEKEEAILQNEIAEIEYKNEMERLKRERERQLFEAETKKMVIKQKGKR